MFFWCFGQLSIVILYSFLLSEDDMCMKFRGTYKILLDYNKSRSSEVNKDQIK